MWQQTFRHSTIHIISQTNKPTHETIIEIFCGGLHSIFFSSNNVCTKHCTFVRMHFQKLSLFLGQMISIWATLGAIYTIQMDAKLRAHGIPARNGTQEKCTSKKVDGIAARCRSHTEEYTAARNVYVICEYVRLDVRAQHMCIYVFH